MSGLCINR